MQAQIATAPTAPPAPAAPVANPLVQKILPPAIMACAVLLTAAWISLLGYGLITLIGLAI